MSLKSILLIAVVFYLSSCTSVSKLICLPWKVEEVNVNKKSGSLSEEQLRSVQYQLKNEVDFRFYSDSIYKVIKGYDTTYGNWYLSANKKAIDIKRRRRGANIRDPKNKQEGVHLSSYKRSRQYQLCALRAGYNHEVASAILYSLFINRKPKNLRSMFLGCTKITSNTTKERPSG